MKRKKKTSPFARITLTTGGALMILSYVAYLAKFQGFIGEVTSEVFGVGAGIFVLGIVFLLFGKKIG